ncbi:AimR family lysis-lysogeny pheromone receptor, partial [Bacillus inaquosorum]
MDYIIKEIGDFIEDNDQIKKAYVRQYVGMKESSYRDFFKKGKISFRKLIRFAQLLAENTNKSSREIMSTWCLHVTGTENIKNSFEYAAITSNINLLSNLLNINKDSDGVIKQAVDIYTILYKYMTGSLSGFKLRDEVNSLHHITNKPLLILMKIMCQFTTYFEGDIQKMTSELDVIQQEALSLGERETFFKECLLFRVCELFGPVC